MGRLLTQLDDQRLKFGVFLVPAPPQFFEALVAVTAGLRITVEPATVDPDVSRFDRDNPLGSAVEQLAIMADQMSRRGSRR